MATISEHVFDAVIIGAAGGAGQEHRLQLAASGLKVALVSKYIQHGPTQYLHKVVINAALGNMGERRLALASCTILL